MECEVDDRLERDFRLLTDDPMDCMSSSLPVREVSGEDAESVKRSSLPPKEDADVWASVSSPVLEEEDARRTLRRRSRLSSVPLLPCTGDLDLGLDRSFFSVV
jgi:hypothetical protein